MTPPSPNEEDLFHRALALPAGEREAFVRRECAGNENLRAAVETLLRVHTRAGDFLQTPAPEAAATALVAGQIASEQPGERIGRYKLLQKIGEGGCGTVYMAEQEEPVVRRVALKVIKLGMDTKAVIARFEAERQALALMDHPNIAKVLDAGATEGGRPFFVMELVRGIPITKYCDEGNLSTERRLELFAQVCHAIQHAHQKGVIHRDVKPSNILVTLHDGAPVPKVIDFGIAKATQGKLTDATLFTAFEQFIGTPAYMSPEQAEMSGLDIDTRSDIYSLGVLLYELLTGKPPFDPTTFLSAGFDEMRRIIREVEPPKPSTRLATLTDADRSTVAKHRATAPAHLSTVLRGDLDWIVMRCLEKNRTRRYDTPSALAADIARHLTHEPVSARPPSAAYRFGKTIRRHKLVVAAAGATVAALLVGLGLSTWQWFEKNRAFHRASEAEQAQAAQRERAEAAGAREAEQRKLAESHAAKATEQENYARRLLYAADMNLAQRALQENDAGRARRLLERQQPKAGETDLRGWEWRHLWQQSRNGALATLTRHNARVGSLSFSADSRLLAIGHWDGRIEVWEVATRALRTTLRTSGGFGAVAFSPVGNVIAFSAGAGRIVVHDLDTGTGRFVLTPHGGGAVRISFSADGTRLAAVSNDAVQAFSLIDGRPLFHRFGTFGTEHFGGVRFSPDGATLFASRSRGDGPGDQLSLAAFNPVDGTQRNEFRIGQDAGQTALALSPDGRWLATATGFVDETVRIWNAATRTPLAELKNHSGWVGDLVFSPDGRTLISAASDQTLRVWDTATWTETAVLRGHGDEVHALALSPDGRLIASGDRSGEVLLWSTDRTPAAPPQFTFPNDVRDAWIPRDTNQALTLSKYGKVSRWDLATLRETPVDLPGPAEEFWRPNYVAVRMPNFVLRIYEVTATEARLVGEAAVGEKARNLSFGNGTLRWRDDSGRQQIRELHPPVKAPPVASASLLWTEFDSGRVLFRRRGDTSAEIVVTRELRGDLGTVHQSHDRRTVAVATDHGMVGLYEAQTGRELRVLRAHMKAARAAAFTPDDRRLLTTGVSRELAKIWDLETGQELLTLAGDSDSSDRAEFSSDGNALLVGSENGPWQLWRAPTWPEIEEADRLAREHATPTQKPAVAPIRDPDYGIWVLRRDAASGAWSSPAAPVTARFPEQNYGPAWSPDGRQIAFKRARVTVGSRLDQMFDTVVQSLEAGTERVYAATEADPGPWMSPVWFPDGRSLLARNWIDATGRPAPRITLEDGRSVPLTVPGRKPVVTVSRDGRTIYSMSYDPKEKTASLFATDVVTGQHAQRWTSPFPIHDIYVPLRLALSPDGTTLAMVLRGTKNDAHLVRIGVDGSDYRVLVSVLRGGDALSRSALGWIENGRALLYCVRGDGDLRLMRIPAEGGLPRFTGVTFRPADSIFDVSPDGAQLAVGPGRPEIVKPDDYDNDVMWDWVLAQELARNLDAAEPVARELLARHQQQTGTTLGHPGVRTILGRILVRRGKFAEAVELLRPAYEARNREAPEEWTTHITRSVLGAALSGIDKSDEAEPLLREAWRGLSREGFFLSKEDEPRPTEAAEWLASLHERRGEQEKATEWRQKSRGFQAGLRAVNLYRAHDFARAVESFEEATRLEPDLPHAWNLIGWLRATAPEPAVRDGRAAVAAALKACELTQWKIPTLIDTLAAAYAEAGDFVRAIEQQQKALQGGGIEARDRAEFEARLELYRKRTPYRLSVRSGS